MAELVDALDLGSSILDVRVRLSPFAPIYNPFRFNLLGFFYAYSISSIFML